MKLNYKRTFFIGLAFLSISAFWQLYENAIPLILSNTFSFSESATGVIMALDNVLALFLLPFFGSLSDKTNTRFGKRTPFIIIGTIVSVSFMMLIPYADRTNNFFLFFVSLGIVLFAMGSYRSPAVALMPDMTPKPLRSKANSIINLMGTLGAIFSLVMIKLLVSSNGDYSMVFITVGGIMVLSVILLIITVKEKKQVQENTDNFTGNMNDTPPKGLSEEDNNQKLPKDVQKSLYFILISIFLWFTAYNAVTTAYSRYAEKIWGFSGGSYAGPLLIATGAAMISYIPIGIISSKIGRKKTILGGILLMSLSYFLGFWFTSYTPFIYGIFVITGIGWASINVNSYPMVVEMSRGSNVGKYTGLYYTFSMSAQIFTPIFSGLLLDKISYRTLFPYSLTFSLLAIITMSMVKHGDVKPPKKGNALEHFDIDD